MTDEQIREYLQKYNITSKELLAVHIEELKRNTKPNTRLISELVYVLYDENSVFNSFWRKMGAKELNNTFSKLLENPNNANDSYQELKKCSAQCFCDGSCKNPQKSLNQHVSQAINTPFFLDEVVESKNTNSTRHKSRAGETHVKALKDYEQIVTTAITVKTNPEQAEKIKEVVREYYSQNSADKAEKQENLVFTKDSEINKEEGKKTNKNKPQISILFKQFPKALEAITICSQYGHEKYKETDLDYLNFSRVYGGSKTYADAGLRHRLQQGNDLESGLPHQYHVAWNALAELQLWIEENNS